MSPRPRLSRCVALAATGLLAVSAAAQCADTTAGSPGAPAAARAPGCLPAEAGYFRARIRGALNVDIDWRNAELECDGSERPDGSGIRLSFAGRLPSSGQRLRIVFGVAAHEGGTGRELPTNLTVMFEGERRLFATLGDDKCTIDRLQQERLSDGAGPARSYRVIARGFCTEPASALSGTERIVISRFDFAGRVAFGGAAGVRARTL
jgi:hypothetical protein